MTKGDDVTMDAIKYLREVLRIHAADPAVWVDARTLALALDEFDAARARSTALKAALRDVCEAANRTFKVSLQGYEWCTACNWVTEHGVNYHAPDCPIAAALALLEGGGRDVG